MAGFFRVNQRVGAVNEQQIDVIRSHVAQRRFHRRVNVDRGRVVMLDAGGSMSAGRGDDAAFGDDFDFVAQSWRGFQSGAKNGFCRVSTIDIGLIHGCDALCEAGLDLRLYMRRRGVCIVTNAPHAVNDAAEFECVRKSNTFHQWRSPLPSGVAGVSEGTRP